MALGTALAVGLGTAVLGAGASIVASGNNSRAIRDSTEAQQEGTAASQALQRDIYNQNQQTLSPFVNRGNAAGDQMNALLGLGGQPAQQQPTAQPNALSQFRGGPGAANYYGIGDGSVFTGSYGNPAAANDVSPQAGSMYGSAFAPVGGFGGGQYGGPTQAQQSGVTQQYGQAPQQTAQGAAESAFDIFRNSTGYQFRLNEGYDAVNSGYAGAGTLQSGAALRGITEYGQNFASNEFGNYMGYLGNQQGTGLQAAGAQAGVGIQYANNSTALNQQNANALSNAAVARANNNNALIGGIGNAVGGVLGQIGG